MTQRGGIIAALPPWLFTIVVSAGILWATLGKPPMPETDMKLWEHTDKVVHALMFGALYFALLLDWSRQRRKRQVPDYGSMIAWFFMVWAALSGAVIELAQPYFGRSCDFLDFLADVGGILLSWLISPFIIKAIRKSQ